METLDQPKYRLNHRPREEARAAGVRDTHGWQNTELFDTHALPKLLVKSPSVF